MNTRGGSWPIWREDGAISARLLPNRRTSKKVRAFVDFLTERFGSPPYRERTGDRSCHLFTGNNNQYPGFHVVIASLQGNVLCRENAASR